MPYQIMMWWYWFWCLHIWPQYLYFCFLVFLFLLRWWLVGDGKHESSPFMGSDDGRDKNLALYEVCLQVVTNLDLCPFFGGLPFPINISTCALYIINATSFNLPLPSIFFSSNKCTLLFTTNFTCFWWTECTCIKLPSHNLIRCFCLKIFVCVCNFFHQR